MSTAEQPSRRTVLAAAVAAAVAGSAGPAAADTTDAPAREAEAAPARPVDNRAWTSHPDWCAGTAKGTRTVAGVRPGVVIGAPAGTVDYTDPHTGTTAAWEYATWTSPVHRLTVPSTEVIASWNARTRPAPGSRSS